MTSEPPVEEPAPATEDAEDTFATLKYSLLGPSLTKAGQDKVDQSKVGGVGPDAGTQSWLTFAGFRGHLQRLKGFQVLQPRGGPRHRSDPED